MGMFDSFYLKNITCPYCGEVTEEMEFQTKQFECYLNKWYEGEEFDTDCIQVTEGTVKDVYGGCCKPQCKEWITNERGYWGGFGRTIYCDVSISNGIVAGAVNIRGTEND